MWVNESILMVIKKCTLPIKTLLHYGKRLLLLRGLLMPMPKACIRIGDITFGHTSYKSALAKGMHSHTLILCRTSPAYQQAGTSTLYLFKRSSGLIFHVSEFIGTPSTTNKKLPFPLN